MNDMLKSLTVVDTTGGQISSISYEAPSQSARTDVTALSLDREQSLTSLLQHAQGAFVAVLLNDGRRVTGTVLGMQWLPSVPTYVPPPRYQSTPAETLHLVLFKDGSQVVKHDITSVSAIDFLEDLLQKQLARCMRAALASLRAKKQQTGYDFCQRCRSANHPCQLRCRKPSVQTHLPILVEGEKLTFKPNYNFCAGLGNNR